VAFCLLTSSPSPQDWTNFWRPAPTATPNNSEAQLLEKIRYYLDHPQEAIQIARRAYHTFDEKWHPRHRIQNLLEWVFGGELPEPFRYSPCSDVRYFVSTASSAWIDTRLGIYEPIQELHRVQERLRVFVGRGCPGVIAADLLDLPRLELYVEEGFGDPCGLLQQKGVPERIHEVRGEPASWPSFDAVVCTVGDLQRLGRPLRTSFAFILGEDTQLLFANAGNIIETFLIDLVQGRSSVPSAWLWGYEGVEYERTVARLSRVYQPAVSVLY